MDHCRAAVEIHAYNEGAHPSSTRLARLYERLGDLEGRCHDDTAAAAHESYAIALTIFRRAGLEDDDLRELRAKRNENQSC